VNPAAACRLPISTQFIHTGASVPMNSASKKIEGSMMPGMIERCSVGSP
jgi:hypothetical protein